MQSWLAVAVTTLSPLIALMVGFEGADWFLRRRLGEVCDHAPLEGVECKDDCRPLGKWSSSAGVRCPDRRNSGPDNLSDGQNWLNYAPPLATQPVGPYQVR